MHLEFTHFSRPRQKFLANKLYGIQASGDTQLSSVMRAINDDSGKCHAVEKRLSRNVADATIGDDIDRAILEAGAKFVAERLQRGPRIAKPSVAVAERLLTAIGVNRHAGTPQIRNNVHYRYENASHLFIGVRRTSSLKNG